MKKFIKTGFIPCVLKFTRISRPDTLTGVALLCITFTLIPVDSQAEPEVFAPKRLSDWLLEHPQALSDYPLGVSWRVQGEVAAQDLLKTALLKNLSALDSQGGGKHGLYDWVAGLPVTGRVPLAMADARWLQANPLRDPVLQSDQSVILPRRPSTASVVLENGTLCQIKQAAGHQVIDYLHACGIQDADWAWIAQADGKVFRFGVAIWNGEEQSEVAPGAWIWAPSRNSVWSEQISNQLMAFLATQEPAPDNADAVEMNYNDPLKSGLKNVVKTSVLPSPAGDVSRSMRFTSGDWGYIGLLQTPTARMRDEGEYSLTLNRAYPNTSINVFMQPFDWMAVGFRYTSISNRLYGPVIAGNQAYKDKSIDLKFGVHHESAYLPEVSVGLRDIAGTGLFSGEFLVANKRAGDFDLSLGLGWGNVGGRGNLGNPLGKIFSSYKTRKVGAVGQGGTFSPSTYFSGPTALFGGVQYQTPWQPLMLKLEYDGNNYQHQGLGNNMPQNSPWNFGAVYQAADSVDISLGFERGNTAMLGITMHTYLNKMSTPKSSDPTRVGVEETRPVRPPDWSKTGRDLTVQTDWSVKKIVQDGHDLRTTFDDADAVYWRDRLDRAASVLHRDAPASVDQFSFIYRERGMDMAEHRINRSTWVKEKTQAVAPSEQRDAVIAQAPTHPEVETILYQGKRPRFEAQTGMGFNYTLGGPNGFVLYQLAATEKVKFRLSDDAWLQGGVQLGLIDNYNKFTYTAPSNLPRVRTYAREYTTTSRFTMPNLQITHTGKLSDNQYYSVYGGYLESMFAGAGAEWLYRPFESRLAFGVDINEVKQRGFKQDFSLRNYRAATGHATLYWDTGWKDVHAKVSAGQYLAKDVGATFEVSRTFQNGVSLGAGITKTNVSAVQFGEGSMDKWISIAIPFDAILTRSSEKTGNFIWHPLMRDGGAKLYREVSLYDITKSRDPNLLQINAAPLPNEVVAPADRHEGWSLPPEGIAPDVHVVPQVSAKQWKSGESTYQWRMESELYKQKFRNIKMNFDTSYRLNLTVSNDHIHSISRAVGRAARTALLNAPLDTKAISITFEQGIAPFSSESFPVVKYNFNDLPILKKYLAGEVSQSVLMGKIYVNYINPAAREDNPLQDLADMEPIEDKQTLAQTIMPDLRPVYRVKDDLVHAGNTALDTDWLHAGMVGTGVVLASSLLDNGANRFAIKHAQSSLLKNGNLVGNTLVPLAVFGGALAAALDNSDPVMSRTGYSSLEAGASSLMLVTGMKYVVGRARPTVSQSNGNFSPMAGSAVKGTDGFPSGHTMIVWSMLTPFAEEYHEPWLYGVAAITNFARVGSRKHWVSDTVAASLLGYGVGKIFWESARESSNDYPKLGLDGQGATLTWNLH